MTHLIRDGLNELINRGSTGPSLVVSGMDLMSALLPAA